MTNRICFNYNTGDVKYYLLTGSSGYASARFRHPQLFRNGESLVVFEIRPGSANLPPGGGEAPPVPPQYTR